MFSFICFSTVFPILLLYPSFPTKFLKPFLLYLFFSVFPILSLYLTSFPPQICKPHYTLPCVQFSTMFSPILSLYSTSFPPKFVSRSRLLNYCNFIVSLHVWVYVWWSCCLLVLPSLCFFGDTRSREGRESPDLSPLVVVIVREMRLLCRGREIMWEIRKVEWSVLWSLFWNTSLLHYF